MSRSSAGLARADVGRRVGPSAPLHQARPAPPSRRSRRAGTARAASSPPSASVPSVHTPMSTTRSSRSCAVLDLGDVGEFGGQARDPAQGVPVGQVEFAGVVLGESHRCLGSVSGQFTAAFVGAGRGLRRAVVRVNAAMPVLISFTLNKQPGAAAPAGPVRRARRGSWPCPGLVGTAFDPAHGRGVSVGPTIRNARPGRDHHREERDMAAVEGVEITGPRGDRYDEILTPRRTAPHRLAPARARPAAGGTARGAGDPAGGDLGGRDPRLPSRDPPDPRGRRPGGWRRPRPAWSTAGWRSPARPSGR